MRETRLLDFIVEGLVLLSLEFQWDEPLLGIIQLQKIDNPITKLITIQDPQLLQHVKELNHCPKELWNQLDHPCYYNETFIVDSKCTFQLKGLCYFFDVNKDPIT